MGDSIRERIGNFLSPKTSDDQLKNDMAFGHEVLMVGDDGGPLIEGYPELLEKERNDLPRLALLAHEARVRFDAQRGETEDE